MHERMKSFNRYRIIEGELHKSGFVTTGGLINYKSQDYTTLKIKRMNCQNEIFINFAI